MWFYIEIVVMWCYIEIVVMWCYIEIVIMWCYIEIVYILNMKSWKFNWNNWLKSVIAIFDTDNWPAYKKFILDYNELLHCSVDRCSK